MEILDKLSGQAVTSDDLQAADKAIDKAAGQMGRKLDTNGLKELIERNFEHPHWDAIAVNCLGCASCTMVCPTCFCTTMEDTTDLTGSMATRVRKWDSCFTLGFSYIYGGSIRESRMSRYRQWMSHKLSAWVDQFGTYGCVGCGRCITWCPIGIDITEEARVFRESENIDDASKHKKDV
jgi:sulfhydrogenase subunit beta (sulfur reductase)